MEINEECSESIDSNETSTAQTEGGLVNPDHLNTTEVVEEELHQDDHIINVPQLPPLSEVSTTAAQEKRKGNTRTFKAKNTTRKDSWRYNK